MTMLNLQPKQLEIKRLVEAVSALFNLNPTWSLAIAMTESSLGLNQLSPTGCKGVFQMSSIAMKDLHQEMEKVDDDLIDIVCGISFLYLLLKRHKTIEKATSKYCDPAVVDDYLNKVNYYMKEFENG
jgi:hypothetical protein